MRRIKRYFETLSNEQLRRVAESDPKMWDSYQYGWQNDGEGPRCLLGHVFDISCTDVMHLMHKELGLFPTDSLGRAAEARYMTMALRLGEEEAAHRCINFALAELERRGVVLPEFEFAQV